MLKVYRPLCPDVTFRLAHDISPDMLLEDDETDLKIKEFISETYNCWYSKECIPENNAAKDSIAEKDSTAEKNAKNLFHKSHSGHYGNSFSSKIEDLEINEDGFGNVQQTADSTTPIKHSPGQCCDEKDLNKPTCDVHISNNKSPERNCNVGENGRLPGTNGIRLPRRPRKLPEIPQKHRAFVTHLPIATINTKSLAEELREAEEKKKQEDNDEVFLPNSQETYIRKRATDLLEKNIHFNSVSRNSQTFTNSDNPFIIEDSSARQRSNALSVSGHGKKNSSEGEGSKRPSSSSSSYVSSSMFEEMDVTHRGMHRFIPRHCDEMTIEIGDPIHVTKEGDDLWCEGINLRTGQKGIFPGMYATDLHFLEEDSDEEDYLKFSLRFLGSVEVNCHKGDEVLCQAINKVALTRRSTMSSVPPPTCTMEISQYGIRMIDKSKEGHESDAFSHFFALKNISFCGTHPRNDRYFGFITKHPKDYRFACHVFLGERSTQVVTDALGTSFKRFYQEYMAFSHPTEDIYLE